jgi:hypothetical protein
MILKLTHLPEKYDADIAEVCNIYQREEIQEGRWDLVIQS